MTAPGRNGVTSSMRRLKNRAVTFFRILLPLLGLLLAGTLTACRTSVPASMLEATSTLHNFPLPAPTDTPGAVPPEFESVYFYLTRTLGVPADRAALAGVEERIWNDACLELAGAGEQCAQVATPGFMLRFETPYGPVEFHTDQSGEFFRQVPSSTLPFGADLVLEVQRSSLDTAYCRLLTVYNNGAYLLQGCGEADTTISPGSLPDGARASLESRRAEWGDVQGDLRWGTETDRYLDQFRFFGQGSVVTETEVLGVYVKGLADSLLDTAPGGAGGVGGVEGQVLFQPACLDPINAPDECLEQPYSVTIEVLTRIGQPVAEVQSDGEGYFRLDLPPGDYILRPLVEGFIPEIRDWPVTVYPGEYSSLDIVLDVQE